MLLRSVPILALTVLLGGCGSTPEQNSQAAAGESVPEITLTMPQQNQSECQCTQKDQDYTFLEKGFNTLEAGEYLESLQYFQRYQRIENTATADAEAGIAIAYLSILPDSPIFDREAAAESYARVRRDTDADMELHGKVLLMRASLQTFFEMQRQVDQLKQGNSDLRKELQKREEAIKRLRDLTLGRESEPVGLLGK
jgi:hypothetical protein